MLGNPSCDKPHAHTNMVGESWVIFSPEPATDQLWSTQKQLFPDCQPAQAPEHLQIYIPANVSK